MLANVRSSRFASTALAVLGVLLTLAPQVAEIAASAGVPWAARAAQIVGVVMLVVVRLEVISGIDLDGDGRIGRARRPPRSS